MRKFNAMVYVIGSAGSEIVKIGTSNNPLRRLGEIRKAWAPFGVDVSSLQVLRVYRTIGASSLERHLHEAFAASRIPGDRDHEMPVDGYTEWFALADAPGLIEGEAKRFARSTRLFVTAADA
jgi:hypothetical protein